MTQCVYCGQAVPEGKTHMIINGSCVQLVKTVLTDEVQKNKWRIQKT